MNIYPFYRKGVFGGLYTHVSDTNKNISCYIYIIKEYEALAEGDYRLVEVFPRHDNINRTYDDM